MNHLQSAFANAYWMSKRADGSLAAPLDAGDR
ncbi:hypothetical protein ABIE63_001166 [Limibacillus sp. MBR-115]